MISTASVIQSINQFNRKERYFLVAHALGQDREDGQAKSFRLSETFAKRLSESVSLLQVPAEARCWMDYHMDWLYAALVECAPPGPPPHTSPFRDEDGNPYNLNSNQEDIDLLVAFEDRSGKLQLILVEAKGYTAWGSDQLRSKGRRLRDIFGEGKSPYYPDLDLDVHFVMASPAKPKHGAAYLDSFPDWAIHEGQLSWLPLFLPEYRKKPTRCDETGSSSQSGDLWRVDDVHIENSQEAVRASLGD